LVIQCGVYSFSGSNLPPHIRTIAVPLFQDQTPEFGIDQLITDAVIESINQDNTLRIASIRTSDSALRGTILRIIDSAGQYDQDEQASTFRVTLVVKVSFEDLKKRKILWEETWSHWGNYTDVREEGIEEAIDKITNDIINRTVSGW
jgi:hypothetical protein